MCIRDMFYEYARRGADVDRSRDDDEEENEKGGKDT